MSEGIWYGFMCIMDENCLNKSSLKLLCRQNYEMLLKETMAVIFHVNQNVHAVKETGDNEYRNK